MVIAIIAVVAVSALLPSGPSSSAWSEAAAYPLEVAGTYGIGGQQCGSSGQYVYCVGGTDPNGGPTHDTYYAAVSSTGNISGWTAGSSTYPQNIANQSCIASSGYLYCVGGTYDDAYDDVAASYFAPVNGNGSAGTWTQTTAYPIPVDTESCVASTGYIYCVGGYNETDGTAADSDPSNSIWYAPISSSGIGNWTATTAYPEATYLPSCTAASGYIYCVGGADSSTGNAANTVYYAALSSSGVGSWSQTTNYPIAASAQACVTSGGDIYCVAGETQSGFSSAVYYAPISSSGVGTWTHVSSYPASVATVCFVAGSNLYCVGGFDSSSTGVDTNSVYYAPLSSLVASG